MKKIILFLLIGFYSNSLLGQTGPGGVGNNDGSDGQPRNILWIDAQTLSLSNGEVVSSWPDISGNAHHMTSDGSDPSYVTGIASINNKNVVRFDNTNSEVLNFYSDFNTALDGVVSSNYTFFWVAARTGEDQRSYVFGGSTGSTNQNLYSGWGYPGSATEPDLCSNQWGNNCAADWDVAGSYDTRSLNTFAIVSSYLDNSSGRELFENGTSIASTDTLTQLSSQAGTQLAYRSGGHYGDIDLAELIFFQTNLNVSQRIIVENYLSAKYNLALDANDYYSSTTHTYDVIGIGTTDGADKHSATAGQGGALYLEEDNSTLDAANEFVMGGHDNTAHDVTTVDVADAGRARWSRIYYIDKNTSGSIDVKIKFSTEEAGFGTPTDASDYKLLYRSGTTGDFSEVTVSGTAVNTDNHVEFSVSDANFADGYYTLGVPAYKKWYTLISGDWDNPETWTLDPSGALPNNPDNETPSTSATSGLDKVYVMNGKTVTISTNSKSNALLEVEGRLELGTTTGHTFATIKGSGRIIMGADNFPSGTATHFITAGQGEGTAVFTGTSFDITNAREFYNMEVSMDDASQELTLENDLTLNGNLYVSTGKFYINDDTKTDVINLTVSEDVNVSSGGEILTGTGDVWSANTQYHQFIVKGDFVNEGTVKLTNLSAADYQNYETGGAVELIFNHASRDQEMQCKGTSNFNQITIDKGTDDTYILTIKATASSNFNLYGRNDQQVTGVDGSRDGNKALRLLTGTVKLGANVTISELADDNSFDIDSDARLWIDGATVTKGDGGGDNWLAIYGKLQISGTSVFTEETGYGTILRTTGTIKVEDGTVNLNVVRTSIWAGDHIGAYIQTGGNVTIKNESSNRDFASFHLGYEGNIFQMSGGTLTVEDQGNSGGDGDDFAIIINSDDGNYNVTGGTVIVDMIYDVPYQITSKAPFYNFIVRNLTGTSPGTLTIMDYVDGGSSSVPSVDAQPLVVLNDLTIEQNAFLDHNGYDVTIGGDFSIHEDALQIGTNNYGYLFDAAKPNTTTFNGSDDATFYIGHNDGEANEWELYMNRLVLNKPAGKSLFIDSDTENDVYNVSGSWKARILRLDSIKVESGILNQTDYAVRLIGNVINYDQIGVYDGSTDDDAMIMFAWSSYDIETSDNAIFGNIKVNAGNNTVSFSSDVYIKRMWYRHGKINSGTHNLKIDELDLSGTNAETQFDWDQDGTIQGDEQGVLSPMDMFIFDGNVSDGGLSLKITGNGNYTFPIGIGTDATEMLHNTSKYTPAEVTISNFSDDGYITITPVDAELQTTDLSGGDILSYYWNVDYEGFTTEPTVEYNFYYYEDDLDGSANENSFVPGKVLDGGDYTRSYENDNGQVSDEPDTDDIWNKIVFNDHDNGGTGFTLENANYTAGEANRFTGEVDVFYSIATNISDCNWNDGDSWTRNDLLDPSYENHDSRQPAAGSYPQQGDIAVIGWCPWDDGNGNIDPGDPHLIRLTSDIECAQLIFTPMEDAAGNPRAREPRYASVFRPCLGIYIGRNLTTGLVEGEGMFWCKDSDPDFSLMDLGEFAVSDSSYILYENYDDDRTYVNIPSELPNLMITSDSWGKNDHTTIIATDITTNGSFEIIGNANVQLNTGADGDITIGANLKIFEVTDPDDGTPSGGGGEIRFQNSGNARTITVSGDILLNNQGNSIYVESPGTNNIAHQMIVGGDISQTETGNGLLFSTGIGNDHIDLTLNGDGNNSFNMTAGSIPEFHRVIMNKGTDQSNSFIFNGDFNLNGPNSGVNVDKALELQNGTLILNNVGIDINLTTGDDDFYIPASAALEVRQGQANANGGSGILLDGKLQVSGGTVDMIGGDNYIQYSASGNATLEISDGELTVGSQIRRGLTSSEGILNYIQSGGEVIVGNDEAPENNRGVFEILNAGSNFTHTGGNLHIVRAQSNPSFASVYLDPETSTFGAGTALRLGYTNTPANQTISIYSRVDIPNLVVDASSVEPPTAKQWNIPLTITDNLEIEAGATFDANGLDLTILGDFINNSGTFTANGNNTYFSGSATQNITGATTFYNLYKNTSNLLNINNDIDVDNILSLASGTFDDNDNTLSVQGNVNMAITHTWGGTSDGILMNGTAEQELTGGGTFGKLSLYNSYGISVPTGNEFTITGELQMQRGVLDIGKNLLILEENADIVELNAFSENNMIQTNISFTDAGVKKYFPAIAASTDFTYPIGSEGKYTPVEMTITNVDVGGYIRVKGANEIHPTITDDTEPCNEINDLINVLKYHWVLEASNISNFTADVTMEYYETDYQTPSSPYTVDDYIAARLLLNSTSWNKYDANTFDENNNLLRFNFSNVSEGGISGEYTAGVEDQTGSCEGAIPDEVPAYITTAPGNWTDETKWDTYPTSGGTVPTGGPKGAIAIVAHNITIPTNYIVSYKTTIQSSGTLNVGTTFGHRLGIVDGEGTLITERGNLPAGVYEDFFSRSGGTVEFAGSDDYDVLSEVTNVRNLTFSGTGERRLPNLDFEAYGIFTIDGTLEVINEYNSDITLDSNIVINQGSFNAGNENSTVILNGTYAQTISGTGDFTGTNAFWNIEMDNTAGVTLATPVDIDNNLTFTNGIITTDATNILTIENLSQTAVSRVSSTTSNYVDGPLQKYVNNGDDFVFPVGDAGRYGAVNIYNTTNGTSDYWIAEYFNTGYSDNTYAGNLAAVSTSEYWEITNPAAGDEAEVEIRWDSNSDITPLSTGNINEIVVAEYDGSDWVDKTSDAPSGDNYDGTVKTTNAININPKQYTLGATIIIQGKAYFTTLDDVCQGTDIPVSFSGITDPDDMDLILSYTIDGTSQPDITITGLPYSLPTPSSGDYVLTDFEYNSGGDVGTVDGSKVTVNPTPVQYNVTGGGSYCSGGPGVTVGLDGSDSGVNYELFVGTTSLGIYAGTGAALDFGNQTTDGTYTVEATDASGTCSQSMMGSVDVNVNPLPTAILTVNTALDTICNGDNTEIEINFTAGTAPFDFTVRRTDESSNTDDEALSGISANPYMYIPASAPTWIDDGTPETEYTYTITTITDDNGCSNTNQGSADVVVFKVPETGPQYHISNDWNQ